MSKFILIILVLHFSFSIGDEPVSLAETIMDELLTQMAPIGHKLPEDMTKIKGICDNVNKQFLARQSNNMHHLLKGLLQKLSDTMVKSLATNHILVCQLLDKGETDKASKTIVETNKHVVEASKYRIEFLAALHEANQKDTKTTIPILTCYLKKFIAKILSVYPDKDGAKDFIKSSAGTIIDLFISTLENEKGKAADHCELPAVTNNPSEFNSVYLPLFKAIKNIEDK